MHLADLAWLFVLTWLVTLAWMLAYTVGIWLQVTTTMLGISDKGWRFCARAHKELWPFAPVGIVQDVVVNADTYSGWSLAPAAIALGVWWWSKRWPDDDNPWRRRRKKAADAVKVIAGRLVVTPREA